MNVTPIAPTALVVRIEAIQAVEGDLMAVADAAATVETQAAEAALQPPGASSSAKAIDLARAQAAGRQGGLAPLFADLAQAMQAPVMPPSLRAAIAEVLTMRTPLAGPWTAETLKQAVARSGLFLEAHLAAAGREPPPPDLKAALLTLQQTLGPAHAAAHPPAAAPPARDATLRGQPAEPATVPVTADAAVIAQHLRGEADQAIARQTLHQLASLPNGPVTAWMFELPLATPQGTALAQFDVERDAEAADPAQAWSARFSLDVEPLGPVHVQLSLGARGAAVTVWAEREEGLVRLQSEAGELAQALPAKVTFRPGAPARPAPSPGAFVDQAS